MNNTNSDIELYNKSKSDTLSVSCFDSIEVKARVTFDFIIFKGIQVTYWMDDDEEIKQRINGIFDLIFEELIKNKTINQNEMVKS